MEPQALKDQAEAAIDARRRGGLAAREHRRRVRQSTWRHLDPATDRAWVHDRDVAGGRRARLLRHHARTRPAERVRASAHSVTAPGRRAAAAVPLDRHDRRAGPVECVAARAFRVLLADRADAAARCGRYADRHRMGVRSVRRNGVAGSRARRGRTRRVGASASSRRRMRWASRSGMPSPTPAHAPISTSNRCETGSKRRPRPGVPSSLTAPRRARSPCSAARGSIRDYLRRSPTRRPPNRAGGCQAPTSRSCRRMNSSRRNRIGCCLTLPDLLPEVSARFPELDGRWKVDGQ